MTEEYKKFLLRLRSFSPKKILHVGGHIGQEGEVYQEIAPFVFVEPVPEFAAAIREKGYEVLQLAVGESGEREFNVNGQISGFLKNKKGSHYKQIQVTCVPLSMIQQGCDVLVLDTEGTVLEVLKTGDLNFKAIVVELRDDPAFHGEAPKSEVVEYLESQGYELVESFDRDHLFAKKG
jgi:hypothetical protein